MSEETGTLAALKVQPGDVVEYVSGSCLPRWVITGGTWDVCNDPKFGLIAQMGVRGCFFVCVDDADWIFRIASRANSGPVRTVTRKEIVAGMYGRVEVTDSLHVRVNAVNTATELRVAITTLTQIADALEESA